MLLISNVIITQRKRSQHGRFDAAAAAAAAAAGDYHHSRPSSVPKPPPSIYHTTHTTPSYTFPIIMAARRSEWQQRQSQLLWHPELQELRHWCTPLVLLRQVRQCSVLNQQIHECMSSTLVMNKMEKLGTCRRGQIVSSQMYIVWFTCIVSSYVYRQIKR